MPAWAFFCLFSSWSRLLPCSIFLLLQIAHLQEWRGKKASKNSAKRWFLKYRLLSGVPATHQQLPLEASLITSSLRNKRFSLSGFLKIHFHKFGGRQRRCCRFNQQIKALGRAARFACGSFCLVRTCWSHMALQSLTHTRPLRPSTHTHTPTPPHKLDMCVCVSVLQIHNLLNKRHWFCRGRILMENELDIPLASPSVLSPSILYSLYLSLSHTHRTHLYIYIYILAAKNARTVWTWKK